MDNERDPAIRELEDSATEIKRLLDQRVAKRPLIIEFSGSPKAGKTRAISVLNLFLRRNGINVEAFTERAAVAPIKTKGHIYFNVWVSCASLQGMLESLYKPAIDIFILDRGMFDALVWTTWLELTGKITHEEAQATQSFFTMDRWIRLTDLVCVMTCSPAKSIEREYADQLTTKRGSIMDEKLLLQLNESIELTMQKHQNKFKKVWTIDTTSTSSREGVTKITKETLRALHEFLDEPLCVIPRDALNFDLPPFGFVTDPKKLNAFITTVQRKKVFLPRSKAEKDSRYLIPIACAIIKFENKVLLLRRKEEGHSLHDTYAIWAGGHVLKSDDRGSDILVEALQRELSEEVFIRDEYSRVPVGLVRTSEDERASRHIGVVYFADLSSPHVALALNQKEFRETRGPSMSGRLIHVDGLKDFVKEMGDWSKYLVHHYWPEQGELFRGNSHNASKVG